MDWTNNHIEPGESHVLEMEGEEQEQENEAEAEHDVSEEPVDNEVYTQHQEAYPGVQGVISVIYQRVSDPSASHFLAKRPAYSRNLFWRLPHKLESLTFL